jgi:hypothetical protein
MSAAASGSDDDEEKDEDVDEVEIFESDANVLIITSSNTTLLLVSLLPAQALASFLDLTMSSQRCDSKSLARTVRWPERSPLIDKHHMHASHFTGIYVLRRLNA